MRNMFVKEKFVDPYVVSVDSTLLKAAGIVLLSVSLYQIIVYYNCKTQKECLRQSFTCQEVKHDNKLLEDYVIKLSLILK